MPRFYVLGYDGERLPTVITGRVFTTGAEARRYADTCSDLFKAFVVREASAEELKPEPPKPAPNTHPETKIPFGYISANALDPEIVERLLFGGQARDLAFEEFCEEVSAEVGIEASERGLHHGTRDWDDWCERECERRLEAYEPPDELSIEGRYEGVTYRTSYLGGALNFWIFDSPVTTDKARRASPCVPGAAILDVLDGSEFGYDVPANWRDEWMEVRVDSTGQIEYAYGGSSGAWSCTFSTLAEVGAPYQSRAERELEMLVERKGGAIEFGVEIDDEPYVADFWWDGVKP